MVTQKLFWSWVGSGLVLMIAAMIGLFYPIVSVVLLFPAYYVGVWMYFELKKCVKGLFLARNSQYLSKKWPDWLPLLFFITWSLHLLQIFVPETGFDALWYHLPVADLVVTNHKLVLDPEIYQTINPLFSDLFFVAGYQVLGTSGAKIVAYLMMLSVVIVADALFAHLVRRKHAAHSWRYVVLCTISLFQVVSWQAASFYVDGANAYFLLAAVLGLVTFQPILMSMALAASIGTKAFSLATCVWIVSIFALQLHYKKFSLRKMAYYFLIVLLPILCLGGVWYLRSLKETGSLLYVVTLHMNKTAEIGAGDTFLNHVFAKMLSIGMLPIHLFFARDYIAPFLVAIAPIAVWGARKQLLKRSSFAVLWLFALQQLLIWWFVPPESTRYALAGFVVLAVVTLGTVSVYVQKSRLVLILFVLQLFVLLIPRLVVAKRSVDFLVSGQNITHYLVQFSDNWIDTHLVKWYSKHNSLWRP